MKKNLMKYQNSTEDQKIGWPESDEENLEFIEEFFRDHAKAWKTKIINLVTG